jgi:hypothetical protein
MWVIMTSKETPYTQVRTYWVPFGHLSHHKSGMDLPETSAPELCDDPVAIHSYRVGFTVLGILWEISVRSPKLN